MTLPVVIEANSMSQVLVKQLGITECCLMLTQADLLTPNDVISWIKNTQCSVLAIHAPIMTGGTYTNIEDALSFKSYFRSLFDCIEAIGVSLGKVLPLILHTRLTYDYLDIVQTVACYLDTELKSYNHIDICVENGIFRYTVSEPFSCLPNNTPLVAGEFNKWLSRPIHTCLNLYHASGVIHICEILINNGIQSCECPTIKDFATSYGKSCHVVLISQRPPIAMSKLDAGVGFGNSPTSVKLLTEYISLCKNYLPNANIILNVHDEDTCARPELKKTISTLQGILT